MSTKFVRYTLICASDVSPTNCRHYFREAIKELDEAVEYSFRMVCGRPVHVLPYIGALLTPPTTGEVAAKKALKEDRRNTKYSIQQDK